MTPEETEKLLLEFGEKLSKELSDIWAIKMFSAMIDAKLEGMKEERERCAKIAEDCKCAARNASWEQAQLEIARTIRARGGGK